ncbi:RNF41 ligase, partial [Polypterus senegalus]
MGYDIERFVGYVNEGLLCCICQDVLENPTSGICRTCLCSTCIHGWLVHHHNCPEDRQSLDVSSIAAFIQLNFYFLNLNYRFHSFSLFASAIPLEDGGL